MKIVDRLLETSCYIIDFLPGQVPKDYGDQFFEVEDFILSQPDRYGLKYRFTRIILKAMCYYPVAVHWGEWIEQPTPAQVVEIIDTIIDKHSGDLNMLFTSKDALLQFSWDSLNMSVYNPDEEMCSLFEQIVFSEGLFWRKAE